MQTLNPLDVEPLDMELTQDLSKSQPVYMDWSLATLKSPRPGGVIVAESRRSQFLRFATPQQEFKRLTYALRFHEHT